MVINAIFNKLALSGNNRFVVHMLIVEIIIANNTIYIGCFLMDFSDIIESNIFWPLFLILGSFLYLSFYDLNRAVLIIKISAFKFCLVILLKELVVPGEFLATEEEFVPGFNTFGSEEGDVFSTSIGFSEFDNQAHRVNVNSVSGLRRLKVGDIVYGVVSLVKDSVVNVDLFDVVSPKGVRIVLDRKSAQIYVRNVSKDFIKSIRDCFKIGDIVKAKVFSVSPFGVDLRTNESDLGVVKAFSAETRLPLYLNGSKLVCLSSKTFESRKISSEYLLR